MAELEHLAEVATWDSGGGQVLDLLTLLDGRVLAVSEDAIVLYENIADLEAGEARDRPTIFLCAPVSGA
ncbi:MAG: hypothetical protein B7X93_09740 [Hydrogenophilales bacterium 17-61-9]|nr:MAG: hypothetical protein B7X93_09740 [Hydrogenophilales bacterium 17-61-9]